MYHDPSRNDGVYAGHTSRIHTVALYIKEPYIPASLVELRCDELRSSRILRTCPSLV